MKTIAKMIKLTFAMTLTLTTLVSYSSLTSAQNNTAKNSGIPKPPNTGTPEGNTTPAGSRPQATCPQTKQPLRALVANNQKDFTISQYPTILFYVPFGPSQISSIEFVLKDPQQLKTIYRTVMKLTDKPGVIKITIPSSQKYALEINKDYRWDFLVYCHPKKTDEPHQVLTGWIRRVTISSQLANQLKTSQAHHNYQVYIDNGIWYDAIYNLAEAYFANPDNSQLNAAWDRLSNSFGWNGLEAKYFTGTVLEQK